LVVDDSASVRRLVRRALEPEGYCVLEAADGRAALAVLADTDVALVLVDVHMPEMDGFALLEALRADPRHRFVPVLVLSVDGDEHMKARGRAAGATGWLVKPFDPARLRVVVRTVLRRPAA
jgi:two-component system chemotaxis response regulator CheY